MSEITDHWTKVQSVNGFAADELASTLQKSIRRGLMEQAALVALEMYDTSPELEDYLWRRLEVISVEDVGFGRVDAPAIVDALARMRERTPRGGDDRALFALHAVRLLALSPKDRTSDELGWWLAEARASGTATLNIPDYALDVHTRRGRALGRGDRHFLEDGALLENEMENLDSTYRERLLAIVQERESG